MASLARFLLFFGQEGGNGRRDGKEGSLDMNMLVEIAGRHLVCALAALIAGGIALGLAVGPAEARSDMPVVAGTVAAL